MNILPETPTLGTKKDPAMHPLPRRFSTLATALLLVIGLPSAQAQEAKPAPAPPVEGVTITPAKAAPARPKMDKIAFTFIGYRNRPVRVIDEKGNEEVIRLESLPRLTNMSNRERLWREETRVRKQEDQYQREVTEEAIRVESAATAEAAARVATQIAAQAAQAQRERLVRDEILRREIQTDIRNSTVPRLPASIQKRTSRSASQIVARPHLRRP